MYLNWDCSRDSAGKLIASPQIPLLDLRSRFTAEKEWQSGEGGREEMGRRKKRKKRGKERDGEESERVDFAPLARIHPFLSASLYVSKRGAY